ncbi:MAG: DNRLRE domain-containing protein, partial [bacterium]
MCKQATMLTLLWVLTASSVLSQNLPRDFVIKNAASGKKFNLPVGIAFAPGNRIFVTEKNGRVYVIQDGEKIADPFIDLESEVLSNESNGMLGIAVDPDFENNRWVYLLYTVDPTGGQDNDIYAFSRLSRYQAKTGNLNEADLSTRQVLIGTDWGDGIIACGLQHVIGTVRFGTDGTLFVGAGEASLAGTVDAGGGHPECFGDDRFSEDEDVGAFRSQYLKSLAGKILRVDPETGRGLPSNPYYTGNPDDKQSKIWAYGLRNPFRFNVRQNGSTNPADGNPGSVYIGDVGWGTWEDLNVSRVGGGENFGWPCFEGPNALSAYQRKNPDHSGCSTIGTAENPAEHTPPSIYWHHTNASQSSPSGFIGASVTAGPFYTGTKYPRDYWNVNFFADFEQAWIKVLEVDDDDNIIEVRDFAQFSGGRFEHGIVDLETDPLTGNVFYVDITRGTVNEIRYTGATVNQDPVAVASADTLFGHAPLAVHFKGSDSFDPDNDDLSFSWDFGNGDTSTRADPVYTYQQNGTFEAKLTVEDESGATSSFFLPEIIVGSLPPSVTILQPGTNASAFADETVLLNGTAVDPDEPESNLQYSWVVDLHHNDHVHPASFQVPGKSGSIVPADHGDPWDLIYLKLTLRVTDSSGLTGVDTGYVVMKAPGEADITHRGTPIALITNPSGNGNPNIGVIKDNVFPPAGGSNPLQQYDTNTGGGARSQDWIGYEFNSTQRFAKLIFQEGVHFADGGWFESLAVQVREDGGWREVHFLNSVPPYPGNNEVNYEMSSLLFSPENGDAIRIIGAPGGSTPFISVGELRVFDSPFGEPAIFQPTDDTRVRATRPDRNYGDEAELHAENTARMSFLKFNVTGVGSQVTRATLQLHAASGTDDGGELFLVSNNHVNSSTPWDEEGLTFNNAPPIAGSALSSSPGNVASGDVVQFDVTEAVTGDGIYSFALENNSFDRAEYSSKEGFHTPELIVLTGGGEAGPFDLFVTEQGNGVVEISPAGQQHDAGAVVQLTARPTPGWTFSHWVGDLTGSDNPAVITMDRDKSITAVFDEVPEETTFTFTPIHDGQVKVTEPGKNYGAKGTAKVTLNKFLSFFKFEVTGLNVAVEHARLRFHVVGSSEDGGAVYSVSNNFLVGGTPWIESILSFSNAPQITGTPVANLGRVTEGTYVEVDVSSVVSGNGTYSFGIKNQVLDEAKYETREGNFPPELIIATEPGHNPVKASDWVADVDWDQKTVVTMNMVESGAALSFSPNQLTFEAGKPYVLKIVNPASNVSKHYFATQEVFPDFYKAIATRKIETADAEYKAPYFRGVELLIGGELEIYFVPVLAGTYDFICTIPGHAIAGMVGQITITGGQGFELDLEVDSQFDMGLTTDARTSGSHDVWATAQDLTVQMVENADGTLSFDPADLNLTRDSGYTINLVNPPGNSSKHYYTAPEFYKTVVTRKAQDSNAEIKVPYFKAIELLTSGATELFMVPTLTGAYDVLCTIPGHKDRGMMGTITVEPAAGPWTLAVTKQGTGSVDLNPPGGEYLDGTVVQVTAVPGSGWQLAGWSGDLSGNANPVTVTMNSDKNVTAIFVQSGGSGGLTFQPTHDGQVKVTAPLKNYGTKTTCKVEMNTFRSFFKFEVSGLTSAVRAARLRLYVAGSSIDGGAVYLVSNDFSGGGPWTEGILNFSNAPELEGSPVGVLGDVTAGSFAELDVTSVIAGNGTYSFGIKNQVLDEAKYETR